MDPPPVGLAVIDDADNTGRSSLHCPDFIEVFQDGK
jgi:hypothetical protein